MTRQSEVGKLRIQSERASWSLALWLRWYRRCGYALLEGPRLPVAQRAEHVGRILAESAA